MFPPPARAKKQRDSAEEQEETARVYAEFVKSFEVNDDGSKAFIKSGFIDPQQPGGFLPANNSLKPKIYKPQKKGLWLPPSTAATQPPVSKPASAALSPDSRTREIDSFLEEIKKKHAVQDEKKSLHRAAQEARTDREKEQIAKQLEDLENATKGKGSIPGVVEVEQTTNLYLGNLSPEVTEEFLCQHFGKHGVITSVKIMYPRTDEEKSRGRNCGFVSFEAREQAESAKHCLDGADFFGMIVRIGWGKAVPKPGAASTTMASAPSMPVALPFPPVNSGFGFAPPIIEPVSPPEAAPSYFIEVRVPVNKAVKMLIDELSKFVAEEGHQFEQIIMEREASNEHFSFLFEHESNESIYYRWRVFAFTQGDTVKSWRVEPFPIFTNGAHWKPPGEQYFEEPYVKSNFSDYPPEGLTAAAAGPGQRSREHTRSAQTGAQTLAAEHKYQFNEMLKTLGRQRSSICDAMTFCLDHSDSALDLTKILTESLMSSSITFDEKIARLFLLSDILYNSSSARPSAWAFRSALEACLPEVFEHLYEALKGIGTLLALNQSRMAVMKAIRAWEGWGVYSINFFKGLEAIFLQDKISPSARSAAAGATSSNTQTKEASEKELDNFEGSPESEDLDGEPLDQSLSSELSKYPQRLRPLIQEWLSLDMVMLNRLCGEKGLVGSEQEEQRQRLIERLVTYELYWDAKELNLEHSSSITEEEERRPYSIINGVSMEDTNDSFLAYTRDSIGEDSFLSEGGEFFKGEDSKLIKASATHTQDKGATGASAEEGGSNAGAIEEGIADGIDSDSSGDIFAGNADDEDGIFKDEGEASSSTRLGEGFTKSSDGGGGLAKSGSEGVDKGSRIDQQKQLLSRIKLREVELRVMQLQVELEKKGLDQHMTQLKCDELRQSLLQSYQRELELQSDAEILNQLVPRRRNHSSSKSAHEADRPHNKAKRTK